MLAPFIGQLRKADATRRLRTVGLTISLTLAALAGVRAAPGQLDTTFGGTGAVLTDIAGGALDAAAAVAIDAQGRIVAAGSSERITSVFEGNFAVVRHLPHGPLDPSFGQNGRSTADFGGRDLGRDLAIDTQGRIVVVGTTDVSDPDGDFAIARFLPDGNLDPTFGINGLVVLGMGGEDAAFAVAIDASGRILVAGDSIAGDDDFVMARLNSDGTLDTTFSGGKVRTGFGDWEGASDIAIDSTERIVLAGWALAGNPYFAMARYLENGTLDPTFGQGGKIRTTVAGYGRALRIDLAGRIVVGGDDLNQGDDFVLARFDADGTALDNLFGSGGKVLTDFGGEDSVHDIALDDQGRLVAVGASWSNGNYRFAMARYDQYGRLDDTYATGGKVVLNLGAGSNFGNGVAIDAQQRIVIGGFAAGDFVVARFNSEALANLFLTKGATPGAVVAGDTVTYDIVVFNGGPDDATNVSIVDNLPGSLTFTSCAATGSGLCGGSANAPTVTYPTLSHSTGPQQRATITARVNADVPDGTVITNTATVRAGDPEDPDLSNNTATATVTVRNKSDLFLTQRVAKLANRQLAYTIDVKNLGPYSARQLLMNDPLPNGTKFVSATSSALTCTLVPGGSVGTLSCVRGALEVGETASVTLVVKVTAPGSVDIRNTPTVGSATFDPNLANNQATLVTRVAGK